MCNTICIIVDRTGLDSRNVYLHPSFITGALIEDLSHSKEKIKHYNISQAHCATSSLPTLITTILSWKFAEKIEIFEREVISLHHF